ncbi:MAG TPA: ARMT1-like domain-containing protein [Anaerolineaceae bacterium]|jgi:uncharacterized protein with ATP-grasp and redox domains|nr:ARMT1-like domain-containing protein [Anaerolineaceae bacterium]
MYSTIMQSVYQHPELMILDGSSNYNEEGTMPLKVYFDCYPCLLRQVLDAVHYLELDEEITKVILNQSMHDLMTMEDDLTSSEMAAQIHQRVIQNGGGADPYQNVKRLSLKKALEQCEYAKNLILQSNDPLETALKMCTAGNIIDFGPASDFDLKTALDQALEMPFSHFDYKEFKSAVEHAERILFLADNAGETVFDRLLIEQINKPMDYVVKSAPIMNDALREDAQLTGFPDYVTIMENGTAIQGTVLSHCSEEFLKKYAMADLIIAKGMANFETLPNEGGRAFFLLKIKCKPIATLSGIPFQSFVVKRGGLLSP